MGDIRDEFQEEVVSAFINLKEPRFGTAVCGTGIGKSKIAVDIIKKLKPKNILILVDGERSRDETWPKTFEKFRAKGYLSKTVIECYQTAYKWTNKKFDLVICDEFDFSLTEEYSKFYFNNTYNNLLGLTGFINEEKKELGDKIAPVFITYKTTDAQKDSLLNKTKLNIYRFPLDTRKTIKVEYKKAGKTKHFMQSENDAYIYLEKNVNKGVMMLSMAELEDKKEDINKWKAFLAYSTRKRRNFLLSLQSSRALARQLEWRILSDNDQNKILIFSALTKQSDLICTHTYHSKNKVKQNIENLNSGIIRTLGVCKAIDRGENLEGVNFFLFESYDGSQTSFQQRHGRATRLKINKIATLCVLVPYYLDNGVYKPTQAIKWMKRMVKNFDIPISLDHKMF